MTDDNDDNDGGGDDDNDDDGGDDEEPVTARVLPSPILSIVGKPLHLPISSTSTKSIWLYTNQRTNQPTNQPANQPPNHLDINQLYSFIVIEVKIFDQLT